MKLVIILAFLVGFTFSSSGQKTEARKDRFSFVETYLKRPSMGYPADSIKKDAGEYILFFGEKKYNLSLEEYLQYVRKRIQYEEIQLDWIKFRKAQTESNYYLSIEGFTPVSLQDTYSGIKRRSQKNGW